MFTYINIAFTFLKNISWKKVSGWIGYVICGIVIIYYAYNYYNTSVDFANYKVQVSMLEANTSRIALEKEKENQDRINKYETELNELAKLRAEQDEIVKELMNEAVKTDGDAYNGLGPASVRAINKALGYN